MVAGNLPMELQGPFRLCRIEFIPHSNNQVQEATLNLISKGKKILTDLLGRSTPLYQVGTSIQFDGFEGLSKLALQRITESLRYGLMSGMGLVPYQPNGFEPYWIDVQLVYQHKAGTHEERVHILRRYYHRGTSWRYVQEDLRKIASLPTTIDMDVFTHSLKANGLILELP